MSHAADTTCPGQENESSHGRVLVVDDHGRARDSMTDVLRHCGHRVAGCASAIEALKVLESEDFDVVITDLKMPGMNGLDFIRALRERHGTYQVLMVTAHATVSSAVEAMRHGAFDYIEKPFGVDQLEQLVGRALRQAGAADGHATVPPSGDARTPVTMIGSSQPMQELRQRIARVAPTRETVLITGESGTGKELVARSVHAASQRAQSVMVGLNCPVLSEQLMESELFGHERGAFTSADVPRIGRFELADGGTILLDEVTEIALPLQAKLLRVLQERAFERVGSSTTNYVDVRILATTNQDLRREVELGNFREDLYFRLAVVPLQVPPLRQRREDIPRLIDHFSTQVATRLGTQPRALDVEAGELLASYHWPGNVRELENIITRASVLSEDATIHAGQLQPWLIEGSGDPSVSSSVDSIPVGLSLQEMQRKLIKSTLEHFGGHRAKTAQALGIGVRTLCNKLRSYGYAPRQSHWASSVAGSP